MSGLSLSRLLLVVVAGVGISTYLPGEQLRDTGSGSFVTLRFRGGQFRSRPFYSIDLSPDGSATLVCDGVPFIADGSYRGVVERGLTDFVFTRMAHLPPLCRPAYDCLYGEGFEVSSSGGDVFQNACPPYVERYEIGDLWFAAEVAMQKTAWRLVSALQSPPSEPLEPIPFAPGKQKVEK